MNSAEEEEYSDFRDGYSDFILRNLQDSSSSSSDGNGLKNVSILILLPIRFWVSENSEDSNTIAADLQNYFETKYAFTSVVRSQINIPIQSVEKTANEGISVGTSSFSVDSIRVLNSNSEVTNGFICYAIFKESKTSNTMSQILSATSALESRCKYVDSETYLTIS